MANVIIYSQPQSVLVNEGVTTVTFSTSGITRGVPLLSTYPVVYQWYTKDVNGESFTAMAGETNPTLTLAPIASYDNDTFKAGLSCISASEEVYTDVVTFAIRTSADPYSPWEVSPNESGANRVRRLQVLGYL